MLIWIKPPFDLPFKKVKREHGTVRPTITCWCFIEGLSGASVEVFICQERLGCASRVWVQQHLTLTQAHVCKVAAQVAVVKVSGELMGGDVVSGQGKRAF